MFYIITLLMVMQFSFDYYLYFLQSVLVNTVECLYKLRNKRIAQLVAYRLGTGEVPGSNPSKGENFSMKITAHRRSIS